MSYTRHLLNLARDRSGVTRVEYGVIASIIAITCMSAMAPITHSISITFTAINAALRTAIG